MIRPDDTDLLRRALAASPRAVPSTPSCLDDGAIAAMADGSADAETRAALLPHLAACVRCRTAVASIAGALADADVAREVRRAERDRLRPVHWIGRIAVGIAAAAALVLITRPFGLEVPPPHRGPPITAAPAPQVPPPHRGPPITAAPAPEAVWPVGPVAEASSLRWTAVAGADRYRVTLFDSEGAVVYETELAGTVAMLPDSVQPGPGSTYWWKVDARLGFDRWAASELIEFSVARGPVP